MKRYAALLVVALVVGVGLGVYLELRAGADALEQQTEVPRRALLEALDPPAGSTYAAVLPAPTAAHWVEVLAAAGVPLPKVVDGPLPAGTRLLVVPPGATALPPSDEFVTLHVGDGPAALNEGPAVEGTVARLSYDLAAHLLLLRQGDPAQVNVDTDGNGTLQPDDLLPRAHLGQTPYADQAVDALLDSLAKVAPCGLPRTRDLPEGVPGLIVLTADQDYAPDEVLAKFARRLEDRGARATILLTDPTVGKPPDLNVTKVDGERTAPIIGDALVDELLVAGHGLGIHPFISQPEDAATVAKRFADRFGQRPAVARNHHIAWSGFVDVPQAEAPAGVVLNLDSMPVCTGGEPCAGFVGGSGRPMRFITQEGVALPIFQQTTTIDDYSLREKDPVKRAEAVRALIERTQTLLKTAREAGLPVVVNAHPSLAVISPEWLEPILTAGLPVVSAEAWLTFLAARYATRIDLTDCASPKIHLPDGVSLRGR